MKNTNITEIKMDQLEIVTGGTLGSCDPALKETGPLSETGPLGKTGPLGWYDSAKNETGPLGYPYLAVKYPY